MTEITFLPSGKKITVGTGETILQASEKAGVMIEAPCGSCGTCLKCKVRIDPEHLQSVSEKRGHRLSGKEKAEGFVLACQTVVHGDITVHVPEAADDRSLKILSDGESFRYGISPAFTKKYDPASDVTGLFYEGTSVGLEPGDTERTLYGIVVDIGTTTLVVSLIDMTDGSEKGSVSSLNPQAKIGQDVLSRIRHASEEKGLSELHGMFIDELNRSIDALAAAHGVNRSGIYEIIFSGNTCMLHLAVRENPASLGKYPFIPVEKGHSRRHASDLGIHASPYAVVYLPPNISAYVGADITSGILATALGDKKGSVLFIDIGTNGEMALAVNGGISATSTAAGPAFEGMNIEFGMRAANGAVESFDIADDGQRVSVGVIGETAPTGICGSGLLDIAGELVAHGIVNKQGKFVKPDQTAFPPEIAGRFIERDGKTCFRIDGDIVITQKDIRQIQLAKGAIRAGIEFLMKNGCIESSGVTEVLIAGSFGYHLKTKSLFNIGLLPKEFDGRVRMVGNTSKTGGLAFLLNSSFRGKMADLVGKIDVIELSNCKDFDRVFIETLSF
jgi:uncharacterized 2Fe-2S/4Fe-4S cluster protein (DUF4445 family)